MGASSNSMIQQHYSSSPTNNNSSNTSFSGNLLPTTTSTSSLNFMSQVNFSFLQDSTSNKPVSKANRSKLLESQIVGKISHIFPIFNSRTRIELIALDLPDNVLQTLASCLHLEMDEQYFQVNWNQCLEQINNQKHKKQLCNFKLDELLHDLRYIKRSKVFILYNPRSDQFKLIVAQ